MPRPFSRPRITLTPRLCCRRCRAWSERRASESSLPARFPARPTRPRGAGSTRAARAACRPGSARPPSRPWPRSGRGTSFASTHRLVSCGILAACGSSGQSPGQTPKGKAGGTIKAGILVPAAAINPITIADQGGLELIGNVGEFLVFTDQHGNYHPWLAESWTPNADSSVWTFKIRQGVKFNDGTPMTVDDVVYSFQTQSDPKSKANAFSVANSPQLLTGFNVISLKAATHRELSMRCDVHPFTSNLARQAIAYTLDRPAIVAALFNGQAQVGNDSPFSPSFPSTDTSVPQRTKNLAKAKQLLAHAGVPRGFKASLLTETTQEIPHLAQIVKQSANQIGVDINLTIETPTKYYGQAVFGKSDWLDGEMSLVDYGARAVPNVYLAAPLQSINAKTGSGSWNAAHFNNPTYDKLSKDYIAAADPSTQRQLAGQIQRLLLDQTPIIFAYFYNYLSATQQNVTGVYPTAQGQFFLWNAAKA